MNLPRLALIAMAATLLGGVDGSAQSLRNAPTPAEFPPPSYQGRQYVDSSGCVFIRAGVGTNVTWVPRVSRDRKALCGFQPSLAQATPPVAAPVPTKVATTAPAPVKPAPVKPTPVKPAAAKPVKRAAVALPAAPKPAPRPLKTVTTPKPRTTAARGVTIVAPDPARTACAGWTGVSAAYMVQYKGSPVRCGPQTSPHVTYVNRPARTGYVTTTAPRRPDTAGTSGHIGRTTRVAPARIYAKQQNSVTGVYVPEGYEPVWEDDRLNTRRAHQTYAGMDQMEAMWTNTVPRRLINRRSGHDVTRNSPGLRPAYTSAEQQRPDGLTVATNDRAAHTARTTVSTRSVTGKIAGAASHRYAQAGIFADAAQGKAAAQKIARAGLPARRGTFNRDGRVLTLVLAGPFKTQAQLDAGVSKRGSLGFGTVVLRK